MIHLLIDLVIMLIHNSVRALGLLIFRLDTSFCSCSFVILLVYQSLELCLIVILFNLVKYGVCQSTSNICQSKSVVKQSIYQSVDQLMTFRSVNLIKLIIILSLDVYNRFDQLKYSSTVIG